MSYIYIFSPSEPKLSKAQILRAQMLEGKCSPGDSGSPVAELPLPSTFSPVFWAVVIATVGLLCFAGYVVYYKLPEAQKLTESATQNKETILETHKDLENLSESLNVANPVPLLDSFDVYIFCMEVYKFFWGPTN